MGKIREKLAVFVGQPDEYYQSRFLHGFTQKAFELDYDVCVFAMFKKYQNTAEREKADSNILRLANPDLFAGMVILKDTLQTKGAAESLEKHLKNVYAGPVLVVDQDSEYFHSIHQSGYPPIVKLTEHVILDHGKRDIAFLNGKKWHKHSKERLSAFLAAMEKHGLTVPEDRIIEGDFWYESGEQCLDYLLSTGKPLPEAVLCANDQMAIGLCKALNEKGIRVPEDILVIGADSNLEGQTSPKSITSYLAPAQEFGSYAMECLLNLQKGLEPGPFEGHAKILYGESCGCPNANMPVHSAKRVRWETELSEEGFFSINNTMFEDLLSQNNMQDYISTAYSYAYQIEDADSFHLCLANACAHMDDPNVVMPSNDGYPKTMIHAIRYNSSRLSGIAGLEETFETSRLLPELLEGNESPAVRYFSPVCFEDICFGYAVVGYRGIPRVYDEKYRRWLEMISKGLECLRRQLAMDALKEQLAKLKAGKFKKSAQEYEMLSAEEKEDYELVQTILDHNLLTYHFQPIVSARDGSIYSYEALMRSAAERKISPLAIIKYAGMMDRLSDVESATFSNVLDIVEQKKIQIGVAKIFINSIPGIMVNDPDSMTKRLSRNAESIVVELTEEAELGDAELDKLKNFYRNVNLKTAVDDYGTGYSNVGNLLRYMPDYVKIDRSLLSEIHSKPQKQHFVREIIEFCHDNDIMALAEGVETAEELRMVIHLGADLIQGYYTARPSEHLPGHIDEKIASEIKNYYQERVDGKSKTVYIAGKTNRISLLSLIKDGCSDIVIGEEGMVYHDITIVGMPSLQTNIHIRIEPGYVGKITLENAYLSNIKNRPCMELSDSSDVVCVVEGDNTLHGSGILVPETARFALEGNGNLLIEPEQNNQEYYGIGNDVSSRHGELNFLQDGKLTIRGNGASGVGIGSGLGGKIQITKGIYKLKCSGEKCAGIGSLDAASEVSIYNCSIDIDISVSKGVGIGSCSKEANISMEKCSLQFSGDAKELTCIGTLDGENAFVAIKESHAEFIVRADHSTCFGSLRADSEINIDTASISVESAGSNAIAFGGYCENTKVKLIGVDTKVDLHNSIKKDTYAREENIEIINGRCRILVNDETVKRKLKFNY